MQAQREQPGAMALTELTAQTEQLEVQVFKVMLAQTDSKDFKARLVKMVLQEQPGRKDSWALKDRVQQDHRETLAQREQMVAMVLTERKDFRAKSARLELPGVMAAMVLMASKASAVFRATLETPSQAFKAWPGVTAQTERKDFVASKATSEATVLTVLMA